MRLAPDDDFLNCDYCHTTYYPEKTGEGVRVLGEADKLGCPVCAVPLVHAALDGHRLLYCERCRGMLISMDIFVPLIGELRGERNSAAFAGRRPDPGELRRRVNCPDCRRPMDTHFYGGPGNIVIDDCSRCRWNWLDPGELTRIVRAPERVYQTETPRW